MKLQKFTIENFKRINKAVIDFSKNSDNLTVLAGQNESGKSSILEALETFYQEAFSEDSVPLLKDEYSGKQFATFEFTCDSVDVKLFCDKLEETYEAESAFWEFLKIEIEKASIIRKITFYLKSDNEDGVFLNEEYVIDLKNFINSKHGAFFKKNLEAPVSSEGSSVEEESGLLIDGDGDLAGEFAQLFYSLAPRFILFSNTECDLLPDNIKLEDFKTNKGDGFNAVKNLENILNVNFSDIAIKGIREQIPIISGHNQTLTADFQEVFRQKIHDENSVKISYVIDTLSTEQAKKTDKIDDAAKDFIYFSIETKDGEPLPLRLRSKGLIWFLSFWLILQSFKDKKHVILIDEPDSSLHVNAQEDLMKVLENIANKNGHQIIYSTHSPFLIPTDNLHRVKLVYNDGDNGVNLQDISERIDTKNKQEAILPIFHAIGCDVAKNNAIFTQNNIIVEGLSDMFAFQSLNTLLNKDKDNHFLPGIGIKGDKINPIIEMCLGYGLNWCLVMDNDSIVTNNQDESFETYPEQKFNLIKQRIFGGDKEKTKKKIYILEKGNLENLFAVSDIEKIAQKINFKLAQKPASKNNELYIGKSRKVLFWKLFMSAVKNGKIKESDLSSGTKSEFEKIFVFISNSLSTSTEDLIEK